MTALPYPVASRRRGVAASRDLSLPGVTDGTPLPLVYRWPEGEQPQAVVIFCHGLGASGRDYSELSSHWAANSYLVIHPTFPDWVGAVAAAESELGVGHSENLEGWAGDALIRPRMYEILHTPFYWLERIRILRQVMDRLDDVVAATCGRLPKPIPRAIAGHSFGAYTSQLLAGAEIDLPDGETRRFKEERFAAAILLSAQGRDQQGLREGSWDGITGPMLNMTGTLDGGAKGQDWHWKVEPYELAPPGDKYLALLTGADHYLGGPTGAVAQPIT